mmetsp:Transcript_17992/g.26087  ORF Transcript_17992/g.26087 Transcript_17992/m.26087 type:complete len:494 (+) Transcript_17992:38-1519(+)
MPTEAPCNKRHEQRRSKSDGWISRKLASTLLIALAICLDKKSSYVSFRSSYFLFVAATDTESEEVCNISKDENEDCKDSNSECAKWASAGECDANPGYMRANCQKSCGSCLTNDNRSLIETLSKYGEEQEVQGTKVKDSLEIIRETIAYMENDVFGPNPTHDIPRETALECKNRDKLCAFWAAIGECEANIAFMITRCAPSCKSCHLVDHDKRCPPLDPSIPPALLPGDLNLMFERIVAMAPGNRTGDAEKEAPGDLDGDAMPNYTVTIHSQPTSLMEGNRIVDIERDMEEDPWIITLDDFLTEEECAHIIELGYKHGYERSLDVGKQLFDGSFEGKQSSTRTSENAWCTKECRNDSVMQRIHHRIEKVTDISADNSEDLQLLKYTEGQFYRPHHDYIKHQVDRQCGPRILTFFLYLSDVEEGGGTGFTGLDLVVMPKRGRALLWPSVLNSDPKREDPRMTHEAKDVVKGKKFAANSWIHLFDFITPKSYGCA